MTAYDLETRRALHIVGLARAHQIEEVGYTREHDDRHSVEDWCTIVNRYLGQALAEDEVIDSLTKATATLLAALESAHRHWGMPPIQGIGGFRHEDEGGPSGTFRGDRGSAMSSDADPGHS